MKPEHFLANFSHIANAPQGINRLREMIYNLAITGALSEQRRSDGDGHSLLKEIAAKRQALSNAGTFKRSTKLENLRDAFNESLPEIPPTWAWSRLVEVGEIGPKNQAKDETKASFASMSAISEMHSSFVRSEDRPWGSIKKGYTHFADGDVVLAKITPCFENGKAAVMSNLTNGIGAGTTELHVIRPITGAIEPGYIYIFLRSPYFKIVGEGHMTGTAGQKRLPTEYFATRPLPVPPIVEQKRIVAKVDELMALCDQLEAQQHERERRLPILSRTCHARLAEAPSLANLNRIFDELGSVSPHDLRKAILTLAMKGRLIAQTTEGKSAKELLNDIARDIAKAVRQKRMRSPQAPVTLAKKSLFDLPSTWEWSQLGYLTAAEDGAMCDGPFGSKLKTEHYIPTRGYAVVRLGNIGEGHFIHGKEGHISREHFESLASNHTAPGDLLVAGLADPLIRCCEIPPDLGPAVNKSDCFRVRLHRRIDRSYVRHYLNSPVAKRFAAEDNHGMTRQRINLANAKALPVPVPPVAEQRRIVAKVDELMALLQQLEAKQQERDKLAEAFAKACIATLTGTIQRERPKKMKAPKTELISVVTLGKEPSSDANPPLARLLVQNKKTLPAKSLWQQSGLTIDAFYQQLRTEITQGWIAPPTEAEMRVVEEA